MGMASGAGDQQTKVLSMKDIGASGFDSGRVEDKSLGLPTHLTLRQRL